MAVTASKKTVYAGDDLIINLVWRSGTKKEPGDPIDLVGYTFAVNLVRSGSIAATGVVSTDPTEGRIKASFSEEQTQSLFGNYEVRLRYTDPAGDTLTFFVMPVEVKQ